MKLVSIGLAAALTLASTFALAQTGTGGTATGGSTTGGTTTTSPSVNSTTPGSSTDSSTTGMNTGAGSAAAGANSARNPSGNSYINPSPSGSTLTPAPGSAGGR